MNAPEITILPETNDTRPEPPKMPDQWAVRSFLWAEGSLSQWLPMLFTGHISEESAQRTAASRIAKGDRRVQVIKIGGDA